MASNKTIGDLQFSDPLSDFVMTEDLSGYKSYDQTVESLSSDGYPTSEQVDSALEGVSQQISGKLDSDSLAKTFSGLSSYQLYEHVTWNGGFYQCISAVPPPAAGQENPDPSSDQLHWKPEDMTTPDATLDITAAGALRVVSADGSVLWIQGYGLSKTSSVQLSNEFVNYYSFQANYTGETLLSLPNPSSGKVGDFILDVACPPLDPTAADYPGDFLSTESYTAGQTVAYDGSIWSCTADHSGAWAAGDFQQMLPGFTLSTALDNTVKVVVPEDKDLSGMFTFAPGTIAELYFTQTAFQLSGLPTWKIVRQNVQDGGADA